MTRKNYFLFAAILLLAVSSCSPVINVRHVDNISGIPENDGIYYSLPKTVITMEVTVNKTFRVKGPYSAHAKKYLGFSSVITENSTSYSLDNIKLSSYSIPDPEQIYFVEIPKGNSKKNSVFLQLSESGIISGINDFHKPRPGFHLDSTLESAPEDLTEPTTQYFVNRNLDEYFDTIIEKVTLDTITVVKKILKRVVNEKSAEQKAKEAADFIIHIKENKYNLLTGYSEINYSKEALEYMNENLSKMEKEYLELFTGITVTRQLKYYYSFIPPATSGIINIPLFRLSAKDGVTDTAANSTENVVLRIEKFNTLQQLVFYDKAKVNPEKEIHGFYYRIPEYAKVSVLQHKKKKTEAKILIDQFGVVCELPASVKTEASFYPNSGSLKAIAINKKKGHWFFRPR